jgi:hypothetical protein
MSGSTSAGKGEQTLLLHNSLKKRKGCICNEPQKLQSGTAMQYQEHSNNFKGVHTALPCRSCSNQAW